MASAQKEHNQVEKFFSPVGGAIRGAVRGLLPGVADDKDLEREQQRQYASYYGARAQDTTSGASDIRQRLSAFSGALMIAGGDSELGLLGMLPEQQAIFTDTLRQLGYPDDADRYEAMVAEQMAALQQEQTEPQAKQGGGVKGWLANVFGGRKVPDQQQDSKKPLANYFAPGQEAPPQSSGRERAWGMADQFHMADPSPKEPKKPDRRTSFAGGGMSVAGGMYGGGPSRIAEALDGAKNRIAAVGDPKAVVTDTGDGIRTTPETMGGIGIDDPDTAEQFGDLEAMVGKAMPDFDLRADFKARHDDYLRLLTKIRKGVPDPKNPGSTRKLSVQEIIQIIENGFGDLAK